MKVNTMRIPEGPKQSGAKFQVWASPSEELGKLHSSSKSAPATPPKSDSVSSGDVDASDKLVKALLVLESLGVLEDNRVCLKLAEHLTERVGYRCAGKTASTRVAELMLLSASASTLADQLDKEDLL